MQSCLCELINTGMCDGAEKQVVCAEHPWHKSIPKETPLRVIGWTIWNAFVRVGEFRRRKMREWHWTHTWSLWKNRGMAFPVAYPWTRTGCFAHYVQHQYRECEVCHEEERRDQWL